MYIIEYFTNIRQLKYSIKVAVVLAKISKT